MKIRTAVWTAALLLAVGGCGKPVLRLADASLGDYYTEKEFKKLTDEQRQDYCQELADQRETFESEITDARVAQDALRRGAAVRHAEADSLQNVAAALEARVAEARVKGGAQRSASHDAGRTGATASKTSYLETYVVKKGDSLWRISGLPDLMGRSSEWSRLFEANRDRIRNPDRIYPGQELQIPR